jgi:gamma-glutamylcyclotransferase (GGCT)/AIG2-like uncharacterized protein YtfP
VAQVDGFFVYGTLMRGESRFAAISAHGIVRVLLARGPGRLFDTHGDYPMLRLAGAAPDDVVYGEFVSVGGFDGARVALDALEGFSGHGHPQNEYERMLVDVDVGGSRLMTAWTYVAADRGPTGNPIETGCWRQHRGVRDAFFRRLAQAHGRPDAETIQALTEGSLSEFRLAKQSGVWTALA